MQGVLLFWSSKYHVGPIFNLSYLYLPLFTYIYVYVMLAGVRMLALTA